MKKIILSAAILVSSLAMFAQKKPSDVAKFASETINQGNLKQNEPKEAKFVVTNIGKEPLIIEQANPTCGCTMGDYTKAPIAPGATGFVTAKFNAASVGHFEKHLTVKFGGVDENQTITITGDVLSAEDYAKLPATDAKPAVDAPVKAATATPAATTAKTSAATIKKTTKKTAKKTALTTAVAAPKS